MQWLRDEESSCRDRQDESGSRDSGDNRDIETGWNEQLPFSIETSLRASWAKLLPQASKSGAVIEVRWPSGRVSLSTFEISCSIARAIGTEAPRHSQR